MYDILQLNDMLVPELLDIAEQLKIPNAKKLDKQALVYKILDSQAIAGSKGGNNQDKTRQRKRIIKASTGNTTEEAIVVEPEKKPMAKKPIHKKEERPAPTPAPALKKVGRKKDEEIIDHAAEEMNVPDEEVI